MVTVLKKGHFHLEETVKGDIMAALNARLDRQTDKIRATVRDDNLALLP